MKRRPCCNATAAVVPLPVKGSSTEAVERSTRQDARLDQRRRERGEVRALVGAGCHGPDAAAVAGEHVVLDSGRSGRCVPTD